MYGVSVYLFQDSGQSWLCIINDTRIFLYDDKQHENFDINNHFIITHYYEQN
jgi:hypothetical protein